MHFHICLAFELGVGAAVQEHKLLQVRAACLAPLHTKLELNL